MCEFCHKHGDGKKWYLQAKNYSVDLLRDAERKMFHGRICRVVRERGGAPAGAVREAAPRPAPRAVVHHAADRAADEEDSLRADRAVEDLAAIFDIANSIVRIPCVCRKAMLGKSPAYCMAISTIPVLYDPIKKAFMTAGKDAPLFSGPEVSSVEKLTKESAVALLRDFEKDGLVHSVWTFKTPFIGGICNCDRSGCMAMRAFEAGINVFFRAEYIAEVNKDLCKGCRTCVKQCQLRRCTSTPRTGRCSLPRRNVSDAGSAGRCARITRSPCRRGRRGSRPSRNNVTGAIS